VGAMHRMVSMARDGEDDGRIMAQCRSQSQAGGSSAAGMVAEDPHSLAGRRIVRVFAGGSIDIAPCLLLPAADTASGRALVQQAIIRLDWHTQGEESERKRRLEERHLYYCSNIPYLTPHRTYSSTGQDILLTRYIHTHTDTFVLCTSATATTLQATHGNTPARARTAPDITQTRRSTTERDSRSRVSETE